MKKKKHPLNKAFKCGGYLFIHSLFFFLGGGVGWGEVANALRETRHETVKTVNKLGHKK